MAQNLTSRLAVCSWSLQPQSPQQLLDQIKSIGISRLQIALDPIRTEPAWQNFGARAAQNGIALVSGMFGTVGEDYTTMDTIRRTGGVVPDETWEENWRNIQATAQLAARMKIGLI